MNSAIGKIQNGTTMNNPLGPSIGPGYFSEISEHNKSEDLKRIVDNRSHHIGDSPKNSSKFPERALVINLETRRDRWDSFQNKNIDLFNHIPVERVDAVIDRDVRKAIFSSHLKCLELAKGNETILVLEDDCELANGWYGKLKNAFSDLPEDWDVLIGNHYFFPEMLVLSDHLAKPSGKASTANFVLYNHTALDKIKKDYNLRNDGLEDIDHFLTDPRTSIVNYTIWPMLSREFLSFSDHYGKIRNMEFRIREHAYLFPFIDSNTYYPSIECW